MNSREQFLQKRIKELELRLALTMRALETVTIDRDFTESVGCAFAWDLAIWEESRDTADALGDTWQDAVKALEEMLKEGPK